MLRCSWCNTGEHDVGKCGVNDQRAHSDVEREDILILRRQNHELEVVGLSIKNGHESQKMGI